MVTCDGLKDDKCTHNTGEGELGCDAALGLKCGEVFSTSTFQFSGDPKCIDGKDCGKNVTGGNSTVHLCYGEGIDAAKCGNDTACAIPNGAEAKSLACGWISEKGDANKTTEVTHMCIDREKYCKDDATLTVDYFGTKMSLECASVRNVLAMGAALISTYLAM